jgi:hypothetical protein
MRDSVAALSVAALSANGQSHRAIEDRVATEQPEGKSVASGQWTARLRVTWTLVSIFAVECLVFGLAMLPAVLFWEIFSLLTYPFLFLRIILLSMAFVPATVCSRSASWCCRPCPPAG